MKTKTVSEYFVTGSLKTMAMMRGVNWLLASWTASSRAEETKTTRVKTAEARVLRSARADSGSNLDSHWTCSIDQDQYAYADQCGEHAQSWKHPRWNAARLAKAVGRKPFHRCALR